MLTFIIPVRHPHNAKNWQSLKSNLQQTIRSIANQKNREWQAVIVANAGSDLPELPEKFKVEWVHFDPNPFHEKGSADKAQYYDAIRLDKGRRVLAGMLSARQTDYFMVVDDDDFISCDLSAFVAKNHGGHGWYIKNGYVWSDGGKLLYIHDDFSNFCGTSHIIRTDLFELPCEFKDADDDYIKNMLGSHVFIDGYLRSKNKGLSPLPFIGAVYRIGHAGAHSKSSDILHTFIVRKRNLNPLRLMKALYSLRYINVSISNEFFGAKHGLR